MSPLHCPVSEPVGTSEHRSRGTYGYELPSLLHCPHTPTASRLTCVCKAPHTVHVHLFVRAHARAGPTGGQGPLMRTCVCARVAGSTGGQGPPGISLCSCARVCVQAQREGKDHRVSQGCLVPSPLPFPLPLLFPGPLCPSLPLPSSPFPLLEVNLQFETECDLIFFDPRSLVKPRQYSAPTIFPYKTRDPSNTRDLTPVIKPSAIPRQLSMT